MERRCNLALIDGDFRRRAAITEGEREVELVSGAQRLRGGSSATGSALKFGYGIRAWWAAELGLLWHRDPGDHQHDQHGKAGAQARADGELA